MSGSASHDVPSLETLCLHLICDSDQAMCLNLDNCLDVLDFARLHGFHPLLAKAERFVRGTYRGLRATHPRSELEAALGADLFNELEREADATEKTLSRYKQIGAVVEGPAVESSLSGSVGRWSGDAKARFQVAYVGERDAPRHGVLGKETGARADAEDARADPREEAAAASDDAPSDDAPHASWTSGQLRAWLQANCVTCGADDDHGTLLQLAVETHEELVEEARAMAAFEQAATARQDPHTVTAHGRGSRAMSLLDEAREGEERARREMLEDAERASAADGRAPLLDALAVAHGVPVDVHDGGASSEEKPQPEAAVLVVGEAVAHAQHDELGSVSSRLRAGSIPALSNMAAFRR